MSATDHGPSNHDDELSRALRDLVDDASLPGLDTHLDVVRGRTRRRRAAKKVALGATTLCVAGALGVAAITLPQGVRPEPVAPAESPSATPSVAPEPMPTFPAGIDAAALACLQPAPTPTGDDLPAHLSVSMPDLTVQTSGSVTAPVLLRFDGDVPFWFAEEPTGAYVVAQDGVIVSSSLPPAEIVGESSPAPGTSTSWEMTVGSSTSCDPTDSQSAPLPPGDYELFAVHRIPLSGSPLPPDGTQGDEPIGTPFHRWLVSDPVPLRITPKPDPVEVRDVLGADTSAVFEALRQAASTGAPAALDLFFVTASDEDVVTVVDGPDQSRQVVVSALADTGPRPRTISDDGWSMTVRGGALFSDELQNSYSFGRLMGTYDVTLDESQAGQAFTLQVVDGGTPGAAPGTKDKEVCQAFDAHLRAAGTLLPAMDTDLTYLIDHPVPASASQEYAEIRAQWIESPRVWWAMVGYVAANRAGDPAGDAINAACLGYWG